MKFNKRCEIKDCDKKARTNFQGVYLCGKHRLTKLPLGLGIIKLKTREINLMVAP